MALPGKIKTAKQLDRTIPFEGTYALVSRCGHEVVESKMEFRADLFGPVLLDAKRKRPNHLGEMWKNLPPKDPHGDDDENEQDDEDEDGNDEEPAVIREPDEC